MIRYLFMKISERINQKLKDKHQVNMHEIRECFLNRTGGFLEDARVCHKTEPPTLWFIAETNTGRLLKVVFMELPGASYEIKTAYTPNETEITIYEKYA